MAVATLPIVWIGAIGALTASKISHVNKRIGAGLLAFQAFDNLSGYYHTISGFSVVSSTRC